jgi:hypothetical protein
MSSNTNFQNISSLLWKICDDELRGGAPLITNRKKIIILYLSQIWFERIVI